MAGDIYGIRRGRCGVIPFIYNRHINSRYINTVILYLQVVADTQVDVAEALVQVEVHLVVDVAVEAVEDSLIKTCT